jgi:hypothetical protein
MVGFHVFQQQSVDAIIPCWVQSCTGHGIVKIRNKSISIPLGMLFAVGHLLTAAYEWFHGLRITKDPVLAEWDWIWQAIPLVDLQTSPMSSLWMQHAQPPGFSLWGWFWLSVSGEDLFPVILQVPYTILGAVVTWMTFSLTLMLTGSRSWSFLAGCLIMFNPSLFYFESYILYEPLVIFFLTASAWCLARTLRLNHAAPDGSTDMRWFLAWLVMLNGLVMTRSLYHLVFLIIPVSGLLLILRTPGLKFPFRRRAWCTVMVLVLSACMPLALYTKNRVQYGFFGPSSWFGFGFYNSMIKGLDWQQQKQIRQQGMIPGYLLDMYPYQHSIGEYRPFGYQRTSEHPLLSRNDLHNINVPDLSRDYFEAAHSLVRSFPGLYLKMVADSYARFCRPPSRFIHVAGFVGEQVKWEPIYSRLIYGQAISDRLETHYKVHLGSMMFIFYPLILFAGWFWTKSRWKLKWSDAGGVGEQTRDRMKSITMAYLVYICIYVAAIGCLFENGENERFRFATEPAMLVLATVCISTWIRDHLLAGAWNTRKLPGKAQETKPP